jgi:hypothetical protein
MVSATPFIQANLQHSIAASQVLTITVVVEGTYMALIQELWYREVHIMGLNTAGYTLFYSSGIDRPTACTLARNMNTWMLLGFSCSGSNELQLSEAERWLVVHPAYLLYDSKDASQQGSLRNSCIIVKKKTSI